ncbi:Beta-lactamase [Planctomycetes bacterium Pla163]|uniref:Beta-lactamase n=1 Tax=Rohdeia mirabilis TaxID=2528008 RepID=A0A518CXA0_9BACT|nr:Beta-lactamase [Planctomycetes bacterium Pla163]
MSRPLRLLATLASTLLALATGLAPPAGAQTLVAGHGIQAATRAAVQEPERAPRPVRPAGVAVTEETLEAACHLSEAAAGRALLVLEGGEVVFERYAGGWSAERPHPLASGTKSFAGVLATVAVADGLFEDLDAPVHLFVEEWGQDERKRAVTLRNLLDQSSGLAPHDPSLGRRGWGINDLGSRNAASRLLRRDGEAPSDRFVAALSSVPMTAAPGEGFAYGPSHFFAFGGVLEAALATSERPETTCFDYLVARVLRPAGIDAELERFGPDAAGKPGLPGAGHLTAREWANFGRWVQLDGAHRTEEGEMVRDLVPGAFDVLFEPSAANPGYGLSWWLSTPSGIADDSGASVSDDELERLAGLPAILDADGRPIEIVMAAGAGNQRLYLVDAADLVVVRFAEQGRQGRAFDDRVFLETLLGLRAE